MGRTTIATSMALVSFVAFGLAALRGANDFWASAAFSLALVTVYVALVGALVCKGRDRLTWAGYAATGSACVAVWLCTPDSVGCLNGPPRSIAVWSFRLLQHHINPAASGGKPYNRYLQVGNSLGVIPLATIGSFVSRLVAVRGEE